MDIKNTTIYSIALALGALGALSFTTPTLAYDNYSNGINPPGSLFASDRNTSFGPSLNNGCGGYYGPGSNYSTTTPTYGGGYYTQYNNGGYSQSQPTYGGGYYTNYTRY